MGCLLSGSCTKWIEVSQHSCDQTPHVCIQGDLVFLVAFLSHRISLLSKFEWSNQIVEGVIILVLVLHDIHNHI